MATDRHFVDYVLEQAGLAGRIAARQMFGEYALYLDGTLVAWCADNSLYCKLVPATATLLADLPQQPLYPGSKAHALADALLDEPARLRAVLLALQALLPPPQPKPPRREAAPGRRRR